MCTEGPLAGQLIAIDGEQVFGRELPDPGPLGDDPRLSRRHARVFFDEAGRPVVEDLGSTNGTWVNGKRLTDSRTLSAGDELRLGQTTLEVNVAEQVRATVPDTAAAGVGPTVPDVRPHLRIVAGPMEGQELPLGDELLIGRNYGDPGALGGDPRLSRRHARIARGPGGVYFVEDLGSTNGTKVNGQRLYRTHSLKDGDEIHVGSSTLRAGGLPRAPLTDELPETSGSTATAEEEAAEQEARLRLAEPFEPQGAARARLSSKGVVAAFAGLFVAAVIAAVAATQLAAPPVSRACPRGFICHGPPTGPPLQVLRTFTGALGWRVEYDPQMAGVGSENPNQVVIEESDAQDRKLGLTPGTKIIGVVVRAYRTRQLPAQAAMRVLAGSLASRLVGTTDAPSSDQMFGNPALGFHNANGEVLEGNVRTPQGPGPLFKVAVMAASSGGVTITAGVLYQVQTGAIQQNNPDEPLDQFADQVLETVRFPSDGAA
jgi:pSer/pThr/pTyr-binding forkhead associated (FHA) protein